MFSESMARSGDPSSPKPPWGLAGPMAQPCLDATRFSAHPCRGNAGAKSHLPALFSPPRDPPGAPRTSASPRCTRRAGSAAKPATWARGWCSPAGSTRPSASPAWTVSTCSPPTKGAGHRGGLRGPPAGTGVLPVRIPLGELCGCTSCCSLQPPGAQFLHKCTQMAGFLPGFPPNPSAICPANPNPRSNNHPVPGPAGARHVCRSPSRALSPSSPPALPSKTHPHRGHPASHLYHC